jgi:hypothetical protein
MHRTTLWRRLTAWIAALAVAVAPARALVRLEDGKDQIFVTGTLAVGYNSNIFSSNGGSGDSTVTATLLAEYQRHAGLLGIDAHIGWQFGEFGKNTKQDFSNPSYSLEIEKKDGRTTGDVKLDFSRQSSSDTAANIRTESLNYGAQLDWAYKVIERYKLDGDFSYNLTQFQGDANLANLAVYSFAINMDYVYKPDRDVSAGYDYRESDTSQGSRATDNDFNVGINGLVLPGVSGSLKVGYDFRHTNALNGAPAEDFDDFTGSTSLKYGMAHHVTLTFEATKDFSITSTDVNTDSLTTRLTAEWAYNAKWSYATFIGYGETAFLGTLGADRQDEDFSWGLSANFLHNDHFKASLSYVFFENWSNDAASNFISNSLTLTLTSRW